MKQIITGISLLMVVAISSAFSGNNPEPLPIPPLLESEILRDGTKLFQLEADEGERIFQNGKTTRTLGYNGDYLGPTLRFSRGDNVTIRVKNSLRDPTTVHWHGADVPAESDGGPHQGIAPGTSWDADFLVRQQATTLWYHPHFIEATAEQVYQGLAGMIIIDDELSGTLGLPEEYGVNDIPIILQERRFDNRGRFSYQPSRRDLMMGYFGNEILVNGAVSPFKEVPRGPVRLRILNGSNATLLRISFEGLPEVQQISSDGGFLERPIGMNFIILSPGERAEVIADFSRASSGNVVLRADSNSGQSYQAMEFRPVGPVDFPGSSGNLLPENLVSIDKIPESEAVRTRRFALASGMGGRMTINGKTMDMNRIDERVPLGSTEIWEIENRSSMMGQPHTFHVHSVQFQVLDINGSPPPPEYAGWKDTVLLWPGDRIRIIARFDTYKGIFMYHCHLLEHEDTGMMGQFLIE